MSLHNPISCPEPISSDNAEKELIKELETRQSKATSYPKYANFWMDCVAAHYVVKGLSRRQIIQTDLWKIAQKLGGQLMVRLNEAKPAKV